MHWLVWLLIGGLATWQAVETLHHGSIFRELRNAAERERQRHGELSWGTVILCPFCLSHWVALAIVIAIEIGQVFPVFLLIPMTLAVTRVSNVFNDLFHSYSRTPPETEIQVVEVKMDAVPEAGDKPESNDGVHS